MQFSPTDQVLASASGDATVRVWSLADHSCIRTFEGHTNSVLKVCFVTRGMQLLSSGSDGLVKLWNLRTGENTCTMDGHEDKVWALAVRQGDGQDGLCVSGSADGTLVVWEDDTEKKQQERAAALAEEMALSQQLDNLVREKQLAAAFRLAIKLKKVWWGRVWKEENNCSLKLVACFGSAPRDAEACAWSGGIQRHGEFGEKSSWIEFAKIDFFSPGCRGRSAEGVEQGSSFGCP